MFDRSWRPCSRRDIRTDETFFEKPFTPPDAAARARMRESARGLRIPGFDEMRKVI
jgi:hypothetical protein